MALLNRGEVSGCFKVSAYGDHLMMERGKEKYDLTEPLDQYVADNFPGMIMMIHVLGLRFVLNF